MMKFLAAFALLSLTLSSLAFATEAEQRCIDQSATIEAKLRCLTGVIVRETANPALPTGARQFDIQFTQPVNHQDASAGTFSQRLALIHRDVREPMVLQTSGYSLRAARLTALATTFATNQLQVEHRYFESSTPAPLDWSKLNIRQSADDFHAITVAFRQIYRAKWVNTGASKGGMTSLYHRRFYPADLDGTVADVAPLSFSTADKRFIDFVERVGGEPYRACREKLKAFQIDLLRNRDAIIPLISATAGTFEQLGSIDVAFEHAVIEAPFAFFQYGNPDDAQTGCAGIPVNGTLAQLSGFLQNHAAVDGYNDESIRGFMPYYFQSATELGGPDGQTSHFEWLRRYSYSIDQYTPKNVRYTYSNAEMRAVDRWARTEADKVIYVYGEFDPWTAGEFPVSETGKETFKYYQPKGNHGSKFVTLAAADKAAALRTLTAWFGKPPVATSRSAEDVLRDSLDRLELEALKRSR